MVIKKNIKYYKIRLGGKCAKRIYRSYNHIFYILVTTQPLCKKNDTNSIK